MRPDEITALGELAGDAAGGLTSRVRETHQAIARRTFQAIGPGSRPVEVVHDGIAAAVYLTVGTVSRIGLRAGARAIGAATSTEAPALEAGPSGRRALAALNGAVGDVLHDRGNALEVKLSLRHDGEEIESDRAGLAAAYPQATPRLALFVHGLGQTEYAWQQGAPRRVCYGARLQSQMGYTPVYLRYNSGRPVEENGRELSRLLGCVVSNWPAPVHEVALIGHAVGALVCRSACEQGCGEEWAGKVRHVVSLGAPHRGAQLERLARAAGNALRRLPETRAAARALEMRSAGIKDAGRGSETSFLPQARYLFVSASVTRDPTNRLGRMLGDLVVSRNSAWAHPGAGEPVRFPVESYRQVGGINHFELPSHPVVLEQITGWLAGPPQLTPQPPQLPRAPRRLPASTPQRP